MAELAPGLSPYRYGFNNPVRFIDPDGLFEEEPETDIFGRTKTDRWGNYISPCSRGNSKSDNFMMGVHFNSPPGTSGGSGTINAGSEEREEEGNLDSGENTLFIISAGMNAVGFVSNVGEYSNVKYGMWRGANGKWYSTTWGGNQWTRARSNVMSRAGAFKIASRGTFVVGAGISLYQGGDAFLKGDYFGVAKSGFDIGMGAFATFGGPPGWIIGGGYFILDALGAFSGPTHPMPPVDKHIFLPDKTYVKPPNTFP